MERVSAFGFRLSAFGQGAAFDFRLSGKGTGRPEPLRTSSRSVAALGVAAVVVAVMTGLACGYRLVPVDRTVRVALATEVAVHPEVLPALELALAERLRDEGLRLARHGAAVELSVVVSEGSEFPALPADDGSGRFEPTAWNAHIVVRAALRRSDGPPQPLGVFEASAVEAIGSSAAADDRAHVSAFALAARTLAARLVAAMLPCL